MVFRRNFAVGREIELDAEVERLTSELADARRKIEAYKKVIRGYRAKELAENPTPRPAINSAGRLKKWPT